MQQQQLKLVNRAISLLAIVVMLMVALAACGGDDDDDADPTSTTAAASTTTSVTSSSPTAVATEPAGEATEVTIGYVPVLIFAPVMLAVEKGYFAEYGIAPKLEPLPGGSDMVVLTANGDFDLGIGGAGPAYFNAMERGLDLKIIMPMHFEREPQATPLMVSKTRFDSGELTKVEDLEGLKVSVNARGATEYWLATALGTGGLTIDDIELLQLPFPDVAAALASGAVDGAMLSEPLATRAEQEGIAVRLEVDVPVDFQPTFVWANPDFATENHDLTVGFTAAMLRACRDFLADDWNSDENLAIIEKYTTVPAALIREANRTYCEPNGEVNTNDLATLQEFFGDRGLLEYDEPLDVEALVDSSYIEEALAEIGRSESQ